MKRTEGVDGEHAEGRYKGREGRRKGKNLERIKHVFRDAVKGKNVKLERGDESKRKIEDWSYRGVVVL